jgi:uncharacterized membrane protein
MIGSVTLFTVMSAMVKAADRIPPGEAVFFRSIFTVPALLLWFGLRGQVRGALGTHNWWGHARRGLIGTISMGLGFAGLKFLPLPEVTALQFATPIFTLIFAALILGERFRLIRTVAVMAGLVGVVIIIWPRVTVEGGSGRRPRSCSRRSGRRGDLGRGAGQPALLEAFQLLGHDVAFVHLDLHVLQHPDHGLAGDAVQEAVGLRGVHLAVLDEEDVGAGRLGHVAAIVEHHRVRTALRLGRVLGHGADHVEARRLGGGGMVSGEGRFHFAMSSLAPFILASP